MFIGVKYVCIKFQFAFEIKFNKQFFCNLPIQFTTLFKLPYVKPFYKELNYMNEITQQLDEKINSALKAGSVVQQLAQQINMSFDEFVGEMRKRGCSEPTAMKIWRGEYENFRNFNDNDMSLSNLRKAADVLKVGTGRLLPR